GLVSTWAYDGLGRLESERLPGMASARTVTYAHGLSPSLADAGGDGLEEHTLTEPDGGVWTTLYDFAGRPVWQDFPDATAEQRLYEGPRLHRTVYWDCAGSTCAEEAAEERVYDGLGRLHEVWGPSAPVLPGFGEALTRTTWSDAGRRLRIEDGLGQGTDFDWEDGLLVEEHVEGVYRKTFVYEGLAPWLREEHTDAVSGSVTPRLTTYTRDALGRVTLQETARGTDVLTAAFDNFDPYGTPRYLASFDDGSEVVREERTIDSRGRISTATRSVEESLYGTAIYGWTGNGRLHHLEHEWADSTGRAVSYTRDSEGQVMSVSEGTSVLAEVDDRDAMGRMTELTLLDGVVTTLSWDQRGRPTGLTVDVPGVGVQARSYAWDARGRLEERIIDSAGTVYGYAEPGWLTDETGPSGTFTYEYDAAGNRVSTDDGTTVTDFDYATGNRLVAVDSDALTWDGLGGVVEDQRGYEFERLPDGRAWGVRAPGGDLVAELLRDAEGLPVRRYPASGPSSTRVWGNPMGAWPLAGDDGGERR
ncbi:MAG TPA: hypothetical protein PL137_26115, partial [Nocardioides sp.]|nr:hypothetical protein [Nocardioides sp.]